MLRNIIAALIVLVLFFAWREQVAEQRTRYVMAHRFDTQICISQSEATMDQWRVTMLPSEAKNGVVLLGSPQHSAMMEAEMDERTACVERLANQ